MALFIKRKKFTEKLLAIFFIAFLISQGVVSDSVSAAAGVSARLSYQGRLTDTSGNPLGGAGTTYYVCFSIYDAYTGGTKLWPSGTPTATSTLVANGILNAPVGEMDSLASYDFSANSTEYLNVEVSATSGTCGGAPFESLSPRQPLSATPYARVANSVFGGTVRVGDGTGTPTAGNQKLIKPDVVTIAETIGGTCATAGYPNGAMWYNSGNGSVLACNNNIIQNLGSSVTNKFFDITGPATTIKTFTFPNADATVLTSNSAVTAAQGGTGQAGGYAIGDILYASAASALSKLADIATGNALISGGVTTAPSWGKIGLTTHVSGILPTANGGTGIAYFTAAGPTVARTYTFPDANATVLTSNSAVTAAQGGTGLATLTTGNVILGAGTGNVTFVSPATSGNVLTANGATWTSAAPTGGSNHNFLSATHSDTVAASPVLGDLLYGNVTPAWTKLAGNTTATKNFLTQTGTGAVSAVPAWGAIAAGDVPNLDASKITSGILVAAQGGTGNANGTANIAGGTVGAIPYQSAANATTILASTATANKVLMSGASAAPTWSTPTFPNASATARKIIVSDGTNWTASTETYAVPGTNGNLMQSDGTNWTSAAPPAASGLPKYNQSVANQTGFATDTYLTGSSVTIASPSATLKVGSRYHLIFNVSKTAAGVATPILNVRFGTGGVVGDASKCALTWTAQTAATDTGTFEVWATFRTVGSGTSAVLQCAGQRRHGASITGLGTLVGETKVATSAGFDSTVANSILGVSVNGGASAAWTVTNVNATLENIN